MKPPPKSLSGLFFYSLSSIPFLVVRPRLLGLAIIPVLINFVLFLILFGTLSYFVTFPVIKLTPDATGAERYVDIILSFFVGTIVIALTLIISGAITFLLIIPVSAPFCDVITQRIEGELFAERSELLVDTSAISIRQAILHAVWEAARRLLFYLPIAVCVFAIGWIPLLGPPVALLLGLITNSIFLALDAFSYPMDRRFMKFPEKLAYFRANRRLWLPFGLGLSFQTFIPCYILWLPLLSCVAATRLYCARLLEQPPPASIKTV